MKLIYTHTKNIKYSQISYTLNFLFEDQKLMPFFILSKIMCFNKYKKLIEKFR